MAAYAYTPYAIPVFASAVSVTVLAIYGWRYRSVPGAIPFMSLTVFYWLWIMGAILELSATAESLKSFWIEFQGVWQLPAATAALWFALEYANLGRLLTRKRIFLLSIMPVIVLLLIVTNGSHHLMWPGSPTRGLVGPVRGSWNWIFAGYGLILALAGSLVFAWLFIHSPLHRRSAALCVTAQVSICVAYVLDASNEDPFAPLQATILVGTFVSLIYALALFRFRLFDLIPVAHRTVIGQMREGMLILDARRRIVDLNPSAEKILGLPAARARGYDAIQVLPALGNAIAGPENIRAGTEVDIGSGDQARSYTLQISPLKHKRGYPLGSLLLFHDVTEQRRAQRELLEKQRALAALEERHRIARELHDSLGQVLGYVKMQAQAVRELLKENSPPAVDVYLSQLIDAAQEAHEDVSEYIVGAQVSLNPDDGFFAVIEKYLRKFSEKYGIKTGLDMMPDLDDDNLDPTAQAQLMRIVQEALTNVRKHARAGNVRVGFSVCEGNLQATVRDNGLGFDTSLLEKRDNRFGLRFMRERAEEVGGDIGIDSAPGEGTKITISIPMRKVPA